MRRALHSFIIALLCLTLGIDSAKACWFWRHRCRPTVNRHAVCPPVVIPGGQECAVPVPQAGWAAIPSTDAFPGGCCGNDQPVAAVGPAEAAATATDGCGCQVECCHAEDASREVVAEASDVAVTVATEHVVPEAAAPAQAHDEASVVVHGPTVVVDAAPAGPKAAQPAEQALLPVPQPAPAPTSVVTPASGERPAVEPSAPGADDKASEKPAEKTDQPLVMPAAPATAAEPAATAPTVPAPAASLAVAPPRPNLFDLYDEADDSAADPAVRPEAVDDPAPPAAPPATEDEKEQTETPQPESVPTVPAEPRPDEPAEPAAESPPASEPEPAAGADDATARVVPDEPQRLWTDASGAHQARGWLVAVDTDRIRILKSNGRHTTVTLDMLSAADRDYVADVTSRLAAGRQQAAPTTTATAGL